MPKFNYIRSDRRIFLDELERTLTNLASRKPDNLIQLKAIAVFLFYSGARISEVLMLKPKDIREYLDRIDVNVISLKRERIRKYCPECEKGTVITFNRKVKGSIYKCRSCEARFDKPVVKTKELPPDRRTLTFKKDLPYLNLFYDYYKSRIGFDNMWNIDRQQFQFYLHRANKDLSAHAFRHSLGRVLDETGTPLIHIKEILGHKKIDTTVRYVTGSKEQTKDIGKFGEWAKNQKT